MCILTNHKPKPTPKTQAAFKKTKAKQQQQQARIICPFQPQPHNQTSRIPHQIYYPPPPSSRPPPPATKRTSFYFSKPQKDAKIEVKKNKRKEGKRDPNMNNGLAPWLAINAYSLPPPNPPQQKMQQRRGGYQAYPAGATMNWGYEQYRAEQSLELERYRERQWRRDEVFQELMVDTLTSKNRKESGCEEFRKELRDLKKEVEDQKREKEIKEAVERGRKEGEERVRKEREKEKEMKKEEEKIKAEGEKWDMQREYGTFERSKGDFTNRLQLVDRMEDLEIFERGIAREQQALSTAPRRPLLRQAAPAYTYDRPFAYENDTFEDFGYGGGPWERPPPVERREPSRRGCPGVEKFDTRLKGIEGSQQRMEQRVHFEDAKRSWEKEHRQEDILLRLNDTVGRLGRRLEY